MNHFGQNNNSNQPMQENSGSYGVFTKLIPWITIIFTALILLGSYVSSYNYGNQMEQKIQIQRENMNNLAVLYSKKIQNIAQIPMIYKKDLTQMVSTAIQKQHAFTENSPIFQFIKEHDLSLDNELYERIQQNIAAGRREFELENKKLVHIKNEYRTNLSSFYKGLCMKIAGYPKINVYQLN